MLLCYSALSPYCRKVRMVLEWKGIAIEIFDSADITKYPAYNPRAEIPVLVDGDLTVLNSADILLYVDRKYSGIYPAEARAYAVIRAWEREADTLVDAIVTNVGIFRWSELPPPPDQLLDAARTDLRDVFDRLELALGSSDFVCGDLSVADFALYPHLGSAQLLRIGTDVDRHPRVMAWLERVAAIPAVRSDEAAKRAWWASRATQDVDTKRINWGSYRLEWFMAHGFHDRFVEEVRAGRVLWSVGPDNNARNNPCAPARNGSTSEGDGR